jgi:hypothetical protein
MKKLTAIIIYTLILALLTFIGCSEEQTTEEIIEQNKYKYFDIVEMINNKNFEEAFFRINEVYSKTNYSDTSEAFNKMNLLRLYYEKQGMTEEAVNEIELYLASIDITSENYNIAANMKNQLLRQPNNVESEDALTKETSEKLDTKSPAEINNQESNPKKEPVNETIEKQEEQRPTHISEYYWLYDRTNSCVKYGCKIQNQSNYGYWTSTSSSLASFYSWSVLSSGNLNSRYVYNDSGIRPVIEVSKLDL